ncbi:hypothetical protein GCM10028808_57680 [Spirosoma migulaei]
MIHVMTVEARNDSEFATLKGLVERSGLRVRETHTETSLSEAEELELLNRVAGSWVGDETGDELNAIIYGARQDSPRDIEL